MPGWRSFITNLKAATSQRADWWTPLTLLVPDSNTLYAILQDYSQRAAIGAVSTTDVNFVATETTRLPIRIHKDGRFAILPELPDPVTLSGVAGTKHIWADLGTPGADHMSAVTLVFTTISPSEVAIPVEYRKYLGAIGWDGTAIVGASVVSFDTPPPAALITTARGYIDGLTLSNNVGSPTTYLDITPGQARDNTDVDTIVLGTTISKRLDAAWAVGHTAGGLDTGVKAAASWYHVWVIKRSDTGIVDALFSLSATAPTMPDGYDRKRRIGAILTDSITAILRFEQLGDEFLWLAALLDVAGDLTEAATTRTLSVPTGVRVWAILNVSASWTAADQSLLLSALAVTVAAPSATVLPLATLTSGTATNTGIGRFMVRTNTSGQIRSRATGTLDGIGLNIATIGWIDPRGRND